MRDKIIEELTTILRTEKIQDLDKNLDGRVLSILIEKIDKYENLLASKKNDVNDKDWVEKVEAMKDSIFENIPVALLQEIKRRIDG